ncbi:MAG: YfiR family protein [Halioglobus sp.]
MAAIHRLTNSENAAVPPGNAHEFKQRHRKDNCLRHAVNTLKMAFRTPLVTMVFVFSGAHTDTSFGAEGFSESDVKAAFVLNFPSFVTWPRTANQPVKTICVVNADAVADSIQTLLADSKMAKRKATIIFHRDPNTDKHCDLAFFGQDASKQEAIKSLPKPTAHTLIVSDIPGYAANAGMIELALTEEKIQVILNWETIKSKGFLVDSRLLQLATVVTSSTLQVEK